MEMGKTLKLLEAVLVKMEKDTYHVNLQHKVD